MHHLLFCEKLQQFQVVEVGYTISLVGNRYGNTDVAKYELIATSDSKIELIIFARTLIAVGQRKTTNEVKALFEAQSTKNIAIFGFQEGDY